MFIDDLLSSKIGVKTSDSMISYLLTADDILFLPANTIHNARALNDCDMFTT